MQPLKILATNDHSRDSAGLTYVYPVVSRRAGGVSVGINLNPNNACNWRCIYCQVPGLKRGAAPAIDLQKLERELRHFLEDLLHGDFLARKVPPESRRVNDIAISGNGEPTSAREFQEVVALVGGLMEEFGLVGRIKLVLITNGSLMQRPGVQAGLTRMARLRGEVWFKFDHASAARLREMNGTRLSLKKVAENLAIAASLCPTWLQTCAFQLRGEAPSAAERAAYVKFVAKQVNAGVKLEGVLLYGLARPSMQPEASLLSKVPRKWMADFAAQIRAAGIPVNISE